VISQSELMGERVEMNSQFLIPRHRQDSYFLGNEETRSSIPSLSFNYSSLLYTYHQSIKHKMVVKVGINGFGRSTLHPLLFLFFPPT
jgi:hypothetical protein